MKYFIVLGEDTENKTKFINKLQKGFPNHCFLKNPIKKDAVIIHVDFLNNETSDDLQKKIQQLIQRLVKQKVWSDYPIYIKITTTPEKLHELNSFKIEDITQFSGVFISDNTDKGWNESIKSIGDSLFPIDYEEGKTEIITQADEEIERLQKIQNSCAGLFSGAGSKIAAIEAAKNNFERDYKPENKDNEENSIALNNFRKTLEQKRNPITDFILGKEGTVSEKNVFADIGLTQKEKAYREIERLREIERGCLGSLSGAKEKIQKIEAVLNKEGDLDENALNIALNERRNKYLDAGRDLLWKVGSFGKAAAKEATAYKEVVYEKR